MWFAAIIIFSIGILFFWLAVSFIYETYTTCIEMFEMMEVETIWCKILLTIFSPGLFLIIYSLLVTALLAFLGYASFSLGYFILVN